jgi:FkbM family methyltransferase
MLSPADPAKQLINDLERRIQLTVSCRATDDIAKVDGAGGFTVVNGQEAQIMHNGVLVLRDGYLGPWQTRVIAELHGHHEPQEEVVFHAILERLASEGQGSAMVELGAWWSYYSLWFKKRFPSSTIVGIEPDLPFLETGRRNYQLNGVDDSLLLHGVVGPNPGEIFRFVAASDGLEHEVRQYGLEELLSMAGVAAFDVVLADIQGAETTFLSTNADLLRSGAVRFAVISTHDPMISGSAMTHRQVIDQVLSLGGHVVAEHSVSESFSGDGLVVAAFWPEDHSFTVELPHARSVDSLFGEWEPRLQTVLDERDQALERLRELEAQLKV